jgi:arylsulfatase A-like enzyme
MPPPPPNIILIMTDQQRYDTLGTHGNPVISTPNLDAMAAQSAVFESFYVTNTVCVPSRASFLTGRYPTAHRARDLDYPLGTDETHLLDLLKAAGYATFLAGKNHVLPDAELSTIDHVFEAGHEKTPVPSALSAYSSGTDPTPLERYTTNAVCDRALEFLEAQRDGAGPFFGWISFPDPHTPYQVPEPFASMYDPSQVPMPKTVPGELDTKPLGQALIREFQGMDHASEREIRQMIATYYGMVTCIDQAVGRILEKVEDLGIHDDTIIVYTSDHGDYMGDHGLARKSWHFYDSLIHVPFILRWPGRIQPQRIQATMAENVDLLPTLLELVGIPAPAGCQGVSAVPVLDGRAQTLKDSVFACAGNPGQEATAKSVDEWREANDTTSPVLWSIGAVQGCMIRTVKWKLSCYVDGQAELYDLENDPDELHNLYDRPEAASAQTRLLKQLLTAQMRAQDPRPPASQPFARMA